MQTAKSKPRYETEFVFLTLAALTRESLAAVGRAVFFIAPLIVYGSATVSMFSRYQKHKDPLTLTVLVLMGICAVWGFSYNVTKALKARKQRSEGRKRNE